jgi:uncharacterized protein Smg (DUF494 family)
MIERVKEIIAFLMDPDSSELNERGEIHAALIDMGYSNDEIRSAMRMLNFDNDIEDTDMSFDIVPGVRVLSESEKFVLSTQAQGHLLMLQRLGWLSEVQLNLIIENASLEYSHPISLEEIKEIISRYVSDLPDFASPDQYRREGKMH